MLPFQNIKREILTKRESVTDPSLGCPPEQRPMDVLLDYGIVNIDKPAGPTSHQVSDYLKRILHLSKAGHSGTLDPAVTGVLPTGIGRATRIVSYLLTAGKEYVAVMHLHHEVPETDLRQAFARFTGRISQLPPIKSSVKRQLRQRTIYGMTLLETEGKDVLFRVSCEAGTYIRKLIHDMGQHLKTGAHMAELRRISAGPFDESTLCTLQDVADAYWYYTEEKKEAFLRKVIQPVEKGVGHLPKVWVTDTTVEPLCHGTDLAIPGIARYHAGLQRGNVVAVMTLKDELIATGTMQLTSLELAEKEKGIATRIEHVFMQPGVYRKM
ncbi:MAG TPA: RNA-guided pseudouridylation complex pseudouridine synthase subunit Cbf5 [Candidatus Nanoarchaeia archaeon]|nr:RNA-guided pseudouridylation complex pseudouridine synthase subunit Cbf5 [Candidatus Nanoarchaeia archaeon]